MRGIESGGEIDVPDSIRPYLNEIAERLWAERAAVMVGAGYSKNADSGFPDWNQLGELFYQKAHGVKADAASQKYLNVLRLAEEVQSGIGRPALENLLRSNIPDKNVEPSGLHVELLELPWVDVFTTNYDTLLERASAKVVTRRYEPVVNKEDIPYAVKPRIVKLHGSFPSERPFIITEEDYRRYPHEYAPFVNTVQQALLENTFCLIGFSGDDPNFLQWIGWIRDNLGKDKSQKIYLVGVFDLLPARLQLLAQRGIIVVDFSCCDGIDKSDHSKALIRFFEYIRSKKPDALDWPYNPSMMHPEHSSDRIEEIQKVTEEWRRQRQAYPGWLILPHSNRENLWVYSHAWVNYLPGLEECPPGLDIQYIFELIWRLERCLLPVFDNIAEICEKILEKYWPFKRESPAANCQIYISNTEFRDLPWDDLQQAWLAIGVAMLRFYREEGHLEKWKESEIQLKALSDFLSAEQREFLNYEGFLFSLFTLDFPAAKDRLENWRPNESQPYWMAKRAAAFAEIGHVNDTDEKIRLSLAESRKKSNNEYTPKSYFSVSAESYQMLLFRYVKDASDWMMRKPATADEESVIKEYIKDEWVQGQHSSESKRQTSSTVKPRKRFDSFDENWEDLCEKRLSDRRLEWNQYLISIRMRQRRNELQQQNARWDELKAFRCDPWNEIKMYELKLDKPYFQLKTFTEKREFDVGLVSKTRHFFGVDQELINAYSFLRFFEEIGLSYRMDVKTTLASLQRISRSSSFWAISTLARLGDVKAADSLFNRESVYRFTTSEADQLIQNYLDAIRKCRNDINEDDSSRNDSYGVRLAQLLPELISRLCCKCSDGMKRCVLEFIADIYASPEKNSYGNMRNLLNRLINSMPEVEQYNLIPEFLKIPFPEDLNPIVRDEFINPFLLVDLKQKPGCVQAVEIRPEMVDHLFQQAALDNPDRRRWAITSLVTLHTLQLLDVDESEDLAEVIWSVTDGYGLPDETDFYKFALLRFPYPEGVNPVKRFKRYVESAPFPIQKDRGVSMTGGRLSIVHEIIGASSNGENIWTAKDAAEILQRLIEWWDADKDRLAEKENEPVGSPSISEEFRARFSRMLDLISEVVGPKLSVDSPEEIKSSLGRFLKEAQELELPALKAEAASLHLFPDWKGELNSRINEALLSNQIAIQVDGLKAIDKIILYASDVDSSFEEVDPVSMLTQYLAWCPSNRIIPALWIIVRVLKKSPARFDPRLELATLSRLNRLLNETAYDRDTQEFDFDENLGVRQVSSVLAVALFEYYETIGDPVPEVVEKWKIECLAPDEFAEIRIPWLECQSTECSH
ncbi:anti-phage defense-associated sirtuin Dsr2 [Gilvimarinus chinensis]|uniref:anti-phage defense-associated sirtuin Dsr2 n=1 Tax=Gilvimarinus chinensis TaxID=396005 RepID=UPI000360CC37|nr:anti-phage defense-associated sirtuin Dsr2 [Gilvimarinus chinensis]